MTFNKWIVSGIVIILSILLGFVLCLWLKKPQVITEPVFVNVDVPVKYDSLIYIPRVVPKLQKVNVDSIYQAAKKYWQQFYDNSIPVDFVAKVDTSFNDSLLTGSISFISRIPLDPIGYFKTDLTVRQKTITNTIIKTKEAGFWDKRFIPYIGIGLGYNGKTVEPNLQIGFGVRIN